MNGAGVKLSTSHTSRRIIETLHRYQRVDESATADKAEPCAPCAACFEARSAKIERFIKQGEKIHFVIPAFPAKSPNKKKVLGVLPDLGELMALNFLQRLSEYVGYFYPPGARVTICSDGHVFSDVVGVTDSTVTAYRESLMACIKAANLASLEMFGLDDAFGSDDYPALRGILERDYAVPLGELKDTVRADEAARSLFNGIHRFMYEDALARGGSEGASRTTLRNESMTLPSRRYGEATPGVGWSPRSSPRRYGCRYTRSRRTPRSSGCSSCPPGTAG